MDIACTGDLATGGTDIATGALVIGGNGDLVAAAASATSAASVPVLLLPHLAGPHRGHRAMPLHLRLEDKLPATPLGARVPRLPPRRGASEGLRALRVLLLQ